MGTGQGKLPLDVVTDNALRKRKYEQDELEGAQPLTASTLSGGLVVKVGDQDVTSLLGVSSTPAGALARTAAAAKYKPALRAAFTAFPVVDEGIGALTTTNTSGCWFRDDAGVFRFFGAGKPVYNNKGLYCVDARANLCTNYNAAPDAALTGVSVTGAASVTRVDDSAALSAAGLGVICPRYAFSYYNDTENSQTISIAGALAANTNRAAMQIFARVSGADCTLQLTGGLGAVPVPVSQGYQHIRSETITPVGGEQMQIVVPAGAGIVWVLNQLEQSATAGTSGVIGCSAPIVVAGASATRAKIHYSIPALSVPGVGVSSNDVTFYFETTAYSDYPSANNPIYFSCRDATNNSKFRLVGTFQADRRAAATTTSAKGRYVPKMHRTDRIAVRYSATSGTDTFVNGGIGQINDPAVTAVSLAANAVIEFGADSGSGVYNGNFQIANFAVYGTSIPNADLAAMTSLEPFDTAKTIVGYGTIFYDQSRDGRIWALGQSPANPLKYNRISWSDDHGSTWSDYAAITETDVNFLHRSRQGDFFYCLNGKPSIRRIESGTLADTEVLTFYPGGRGGNLLSWHFTEDAAGNLYTTLYSQDPGGVAAGDGNQYIYKCAAANRGASGTWVRYSYLVSAFPTLRHVHSLVCSPYTDEIYVTIGDDTATPSNRKTVKSANKFGNDFAMAVQAGAAVDITVITGFDAAHDAATGVTFTREGVIFTTDASGSENAIYALAYGNTVAKKTRVLQNPMHLSPQYFARAISDNEIWVAVVDEGLSNTQVGYLAKYRKQNGAYGRWYLDRQLSVDGRQVTGIDYYEIGHNGRGVIPAGAPYVYVTMRRQSDGLVTLLRVDK